MEEIYQDIINYVNSVAKNPFEILPIAAVVTTSLYFYTLARVKGVRDMFVGKDTFFSRAYIPVWNKACRIAGEKQITNEAEFQELLKDCRGETQESKLETTTQKGDSN